jgi:hypothetical protein
LTTHAPEIEKHDEKVPASVELPLGDTDLDSPVCTPTTTGAELYTSPTEIQVVDLYTVGSDEPEEFKISPFTEVPFVHGISLNGPKGSVVHVRGVFDSGAMVNAMCSSVYNKVKHRLSALRTSKRRLRMADGSIIPSIGQWVGRISIGKAAVVCAFEVFPSGGSWAFLVGKPMQRLFGAIHNHATDEVSIPNGAGYDVLVNEIHYKHAVDILAHVGLGPTSDIKQSGIFGGSPIKPNYPTTTNSKVLRQETMAGDVEVPSKEVLPDNSQETNPVGEPNTPWTEVWKADVQNQPNDPDPGSPQPEVDINADKSLFTRKTDPFKKERVEAVVAAIHVGNDLSPEETTIVKELIREYADCFALSMNEVHHVVLR